MGKSNILSVPQKGEVRKAILSLLKIIKDEQKEEYKKQIANNVIDVNKIKDTMLKKIDFEFSTKLTNYLKEDRKISKALEEIKEQIKKTEMSKSPASLASTNEKVLTEISKKLEKLDGIEDKITKKIVKEFIDENEDEDEDSDEVDEYTIKLTEILKKLEKLDHIKKDAATIKHNANILVDRAGTGFKSLGLFMGGMLAAGVFLLISGDISIVVGQ